MSSQILSNRYQILQILGSGGFGTTYLAEDIQMPSRRKCVVKQLRPINDNPQIYQLVQERFQREAATLESLGDVNGQIPCLYAYFSETGHFYLIQEWIEGMTLRDKVQQEGLVSESVVRQILMDILPVLAYVHDKHIVHRDIKPDNIILRKRDGKPVLIDFGAVRETMGTVVNSQGQSGSSIVIGTPGFMPSEQAAGRPIYSSDLYSLGLTMIYLLTGKFPQDLEVDPSSGDILWRKATPHVSSSFADLLDRSIQYHPRDRFVSAQEMLAALQGITAPGLEPTVVPLANERLPEIITNSVPPAVPPTVVNSPTMHQAGSVPPATVGSVPPGAFAATPLPNSMTTGASKEVPPEIVGWNWGAFLLPGLWCINNQVWLGLLSWSGCFTVALGWLGGGFFLGVKGNELAWKSRPWSSVEAFKRNQRHWAIGGCITWGSLIGLFTAIIIFTPTPDEPVVTDSDAVPPTDSEVVPPSPENNPAFPDVPFTDVAPSPANPAPVTPSSSNVFYQEPSGLFEISLPPGYTYEETGSGIAFASGDQGFAGSVDFGSAQGQQLTNEQLETGLKAEYETRLTSVTWQGSEVQPDGSIRVDWVGTDPEGNQLDAISFIEQRGDMIYILNLFGVNTPYQNYNNDAQAIVNTYRVRQ